MLIIFLILPFVLAKSYTVDKANIDIVVNPDASLDIDEKITFNFNGPFTFAYRDFALSDERLSDIKVYDVTNGQKTPLTYDLTTLASFNKRIKWFYDANNEKKEFLISYKLTNALKVYDDVTEFNWKIWGDGWDHSVQDIEGTFDLPGIIDSNEVYTWGHPQLNGKIGFMNNKTIIFQTLDVPAYQWVELRVAFPSRILSSNSEGKYIGGEGLQNIIEEEDDYKNVGTKDKSVNSFLGIAALFGILSIGNILLYGFLILFVVLGLFRKTNHLAKQIYKWILFGMIVLVILTLIIIPLENSITTNYFILNLLPIAGIIIIFLTLYFIFGREQKINDNAIYERDIPYNYSPAIVSALINQHNKKPTIEDYVATIMYLCIKGKLRLEVIKKKKFLGIFGKDTDYDIIIKNSDDGDLRKHESMVLDIIKKYSKNDKILFSKLEKELGSPANDFPKEFEKWQRQVKKEAVKEGFFDNKDTFLLFNVLSFFTIAVGIYIMIIEGVFGYLIAGIFGVVINYIFKQALPRRTPLGAEHYLKWKHLRQYLNDFTMMKDNPPESIILWEKFLVYGITLGVADNVEKVMKITLPDKNTKSSIFVGAVNYHALAASGFSSNVNSFSNSFATASGTSGGGGFGGGGGGGGGGAG